MYSSSLAPRPIDAMLRMVPGFAWLDSDGLDQLASVSSIAEAPKGTALFREGSSPDPRFPGMALRRCGG